MKTDTGKKIIAYIRDGLVMTIRLPGQPKENDIRILAGYYKEGGWMQIYSKKEWRKCCGVNFETN